MAMAAPTNPRPPETTRLEAPEVGVEEGVIPEAPVAVELNERLRVSRAKKESERLDERTQRKRPRKRQRKRCG